MWSSKMPVCFDVYIILAHPFFVIPETARRVLQLLHISHAPKSTIAYWGYVADAYTVS